MDQKAIERTVYLRDATVSGLEVTLQEFGACRMRKNLDGWRWRFAASDDVAIEIQVLENVDSWQMELVVENLDKWRAPFAGQGWEPTIAAMLLCDESPDAVSAASELVQGILINHPGVAGAVERRPDGW